MKIRWDRRAIRDLNEIGAYIVVDNPIAASQMVVNTEDRVASLADFPEQGRHGRVRGTRELVVPPYIVA